MRMFTNYYDMGAEGAAKRRRRTWIRALIVAAVLGASAVLISGCGFQIRGADLKLPFQRIAVQGDGSVANEIRQALAGQPNLRIVQKSVDAQAVLIVMSQSVDRTIVAFSSAGRPREIQLRMRVMYRVTDGFAVELSPPQEISQTRDITVSESEALAMTSAETFMIDDMQRDLAQQLIRRLRAIRPAGN
jgi:LPS-assembly lipoprotein